MNLHKRYIYAIYANESDLQDANFVSKIAMYDPMPILHDGLQYHPV